MGASPAFVSLASSLPILRGTRLSPRSPLWAWSCCTQQLRSHSYTPHPARRSFATVTAHRPDTLVSQPPPRNAGVAETSISKGQSSSNDFSSTLHETSAPLTPSAELSNASITENEAQRPKSTSNAIGSLASANAAASSYSQVKAPRKSKLKPRKAAMTLTPRAVEQLQDLLRQPEPKLIRVGVKNRGCSGLAYHLEYVEKAGSFDEAVDQDGVKVLIDSKALFSIIGSEMDWIEDKLSQRFIFRNPNISTF